MNFAYEMIKCRLIDKHGGYSMITYYPLLGNTFLYRSTVLDINAPFKEFLENDFPVAVEEIKEEYIRLKSDEINFLNSINPNNRNISDKIEGIDNKTNDTLGFQKHRYELVYEEFERALDGIAAKLNKLKDKINDKFSTMENDERDRIYSLKEAEELIEHINEAWLVLSYFGEYKK